MHEAQSASTKISAEATVKMAMQHAAFGRGKALFMSLPRNDVPMVLLPGRSR